MHEQPLCRRCGPLHVGPAAAAVISEVWCQPQAVAPQACPMPALAAGCRAYMRRLQQVTGRLGEGGGRCGVLRTRRAATGARVLVAAGGRRFQVWCYS
jgi:hypothetical protein